MKLASLGAIAWLTASAAVASEAPGDSPATFTAVQPELFAARGALANAWADFDGDGDLDLAVAFSTGEVRLYRNDRGIFTNVGPAAGLPATGQEARAIAWGDFDSDGDPDLYISTRSRKYLYRNDGGGRFAEIAQQVGLDAPESSGRQASWIDFDNDGDLDLFLASRSGPNMLFRNDGGRFTEIAASLGLADPRASVGACWFDYDRDGRLDLFVSNQDGGSDALYHNDGGRFVDVAAQLRVDRPGRDKADGSVGCTVGDYDNDGDFDLFVAAYGTSVLYSNDGKGGFAEVAAAQGVAVTGHHVAATWLDYDNDGRLDLFVTGYEGKGDTATAADHLFRNTGAGFVDAIEPDSPLNGGDHGVQVADYDRDGDLDIALAQHYPVNGHHPLLRNDLPAAARRRSLQVDVVDAKGRHSRAGAEVRLFDAAGTLLGARLVSTGDGYDSQSVMPVHFGLAAPARITVEVTYLTPAGRQTKCIARVDPARFTGRSLVVKLP